MFIIVVNPTSAHGEVEGKVGRWNRSRTLATFRSDLRHWFWRHTGIDAWQITHGGVLISFTNIPYVPVIDSCAIEHIGMPRMVSEILLLYFRATPDMDENMDYTYVRGTFACVRRSYQVINHRIFSRTT